MPIIGYGIYFMQLFITKLHFLHLLFRVFFARLCFLHERESNVSLVEIMKRKLRAMYVKRENNSIEYYVISPVRCFHAPKSLENQHNQFRGIVFARPPLAPFDLHIDQFYSPPA